MLKGKRVLITRAEKQAKTFADMVERIGGTAEILPMIELKQMPNLEELHQVFEQFEKIDWLVFTSANTVQFFFQAAENYGLKFYFYPNLKIATVGEKTKLALEQLGYRTNFVPIEYTAAVLARDMDQFIEGKNILIPRSAKASNSYLNVFEARGAKVQTIDLYDNYAIQHSTETFLQSMNKGMDFLTFMSGSAVKAFVDNNMNSGFEIRNEKVVCIGPSTAKVAFELGLKVDLLASPHTAEQMIEIMNK